MNRIFKTRHFFQSLAADLLARTPEQLKWAVADGALLEICHEHKH